MERDGARRARESVVPRLLYDETFQRAAWFIIQNNDYDTVADVAAMHRLVVPPFAAG